MMSLILAMLLLFLVAAYYVALVALLILAIVNFGTMFGISCMLMFLVLAVLGIKLG